MARPAVVLVCRQGYFTAAAVEATVPVLQMYCLGMAAYFCNHILLRAFFAQKDTRTPMWIACSLAGVNMVLVVVGVFTPLKAAAIGLASAITQTINVLLLVWVLRRRWGRIGLRRIAASAARTVVATTAMAAAALGAVHYLRPVAERLSDSVKASAGMLTAGGIIAGIAAFAVVAIVLRCPELGELRRRERNDAAEQS